MKFVNFDDLIKNYTECIKLEKIINIESILFDEYKLLQLLGFTVNYSKISNTENANTIDAYNCIICNKISDIKDEQIQKFVKMFK